MSKRFTLANKIERLSPTDPFYAQLGQCIDDAVAKSSESEEHLRLAYFLAHGMARVPQTFSMTAEWDSGLIGTNQQLLMDQTIPQDVFILETTYTVLRPNYAPSSLGTPSSNYYNAKSPGISLTIQVEGGIFGDQYAVNILQTPIENMLPHADRPQISGQSWPTNWYLPYATEPMGTATLTRALADSEIPYTLVVTMKAMNLKCRNLHALRGNVARSEMMTYLQQEGLLIA